MQNRYNIYFLTLVCFLLFNVRQTSGKPNVSISPIPSWTVARTPKNQAPPNKNKISDGYILSLYDEQVNIEAQTTFIHYAKEIVNEQGVQDNSEISISFSHAYQSLQFHKISVYRNGAEINKLNLSKIKIINTESDRNQYQYHEIHTAVAILDDVRKGDRIEVAYSVKGFNPIFKNKYCSKFTFASRTRIENYYASILCSTNRKLNFKHYNKAEKPAVKNIGGNTVYNWDYGSMDAYTNSEVFPDWYIDYPYVEISEYNNWQEVADWAYEIMNHNGYNLPEDLKKLAQKWKSDSKSETELAAKATRFVQNEIRYLGMEIGENSHKPHTPQETYTNRYGDCKDKSVLLTTLLQFLEIIAEPVLVNTVTQEHVAEHLPGSDKFNHVIVKAKISGLDVWIDPTIPFQSGDILQNYLPHYGKGLPVNNRGAGLESISHKSQASMYITETFALPNDNSAKAELRVETEYERGDADYMRDKISAGIDNLERDYEKYYTDLYGKAEVQDKIGIDDDPVLNKITINEVYSIDHPWKDEADEAYFSTYSKAINSKLVDPKNSSGNHPIALGYPCNLEHDITVDFPSGWRIEPENKTIDRASYYFEFRSELLSEQTVKLHYTFRTHRDYIGTEDIANYKKDYKTITGYLAYNFSFNQSLQKTLSNLEARGSGNVNMVSLFMGIVCFIGTFMVLRSLNKKESRYTSHTDTPPAIGGWLGILGFVLIIKSCLYLYTIFTGDYFSTKVWLVLNSIGATDMQLLLIFEMMVIITCLVYTCWLLYWFFSRRDIFPRMFVILAFIELGANIIFTIVGLSSSSVKEISPDYTEEMAKAAGKSLVFCLIWVTAVLNSDRVKETFIRPYQYKHLPHEPEMDELPIPEEAAPLSEEQYGLSRIPQDNQGTDNSQTAF